MLEAVLRLEVHPILFGPQVRQECRTIERTLDEIVQSKCAVILNDEELPFSRYVELTERYNLGAGETECLAFAELTGARVSCDDGRARRMIESELGRGRLTGSIGLMKAAVKSGLVSAAEARAAHAAMIRCGGFLPPAEFP